MLEISGKPLALATALEKLEAAEGQVPMAIPPTVAPLAQVNPLAAFGGGLTRLFATHPSTAKRVERLRAIAFAIGQAVLTLDALAALKGRPNPAQAARGPLRGSVGP